MPTNRKHSSIVLRSVLTVALLLSAAGLHAQVEQITLDRDWQFRQAASPAGNGDTAADLAQWRSAVVPGDIHLDLLREKLIPDPFYRTNETRLQWISKADWEYRTRIDVPAPLLSREHVDLVFEGLDSYAHVLLNGHELLTANNMFRIWRVDAKPFLKSGGNELRIVFPAPDEAAMKIAQKDPWYPRTHVEAKTYVRKAAYEYGWDWGPTFVTSGIWRPARLEAWSGARIGALAIQQGDIRKDSAHITAGVQLFSTAEKSATMRLSYAGPDGAEKTITTPVLLHAGENNVTIPVSIEHPSLWYPAGYGEQARYRFRLTLESNGKPLDGRETRTGLRSVVLRRDADPWGRSFELVINGIPVFAKGADVIPFDSFPNRVTPETYRHILQSARDSNMNMIRLWGGGYYETDTFYDLCDELGLMIWHDFMFGNDWQPGTYDFKQNVEQEAEDQLRRLRNHPSIVVWCGNNETEWAFHWKDRDKLDEATRLQMWQDYLTLFHGVLARSVARFDPEIPYWPSSPSADLEEQTDTYKSGDDHIWDVWHGRVPFGTYETHHPRFVTEYGFQSFPELRTVDTFTLPQDRTGTLTPVMLAHQKNNEGNELINIYMLRDYPTPKNFPAFLYMSQVLQAEGIKIGAEHFRRERPETMGSIYWQLNDCWPVASWSSIDSLGRWKALQFYAKRFYAPLLISPHVENGSLRVYAISDRTEPRAATINVAVHRLDGSTVLTKSMQVSVPPLSSTSVFSEPMTEIAKAAGGDLAKLYVTASMTAAGEEPSKNLIYLVPTKEVTLPHATLQVQVTPSANGADVTVHSDALARSVYLDAGTGTTLFSDNFFDLQPNESRTIHVTDADAGALRDHIQAISVADALGAGN